MSDAAGTAYPTPTSTAVTAVMRGNRRRDTRPEIAIRSLLHRRGHRFRKEYTFAVEGVRTRIDIAWPGRQVAVYVDGCFWHSCPEHGTTPRSNSGYWGPKLARNTERDQRNTAALELAGWTVVRIWEHVPPEHAVERIELTLEQRGDGS